MSIKADVTAAIVKSPLPYRAILVTRTEGIITNTVRNAEK